MNFTSIFQWRCNFKPIWRAWEALESECRSIAGFVDKRHLQRHLKGQFEAALTVVAEVAANRQLLSGDLEFVRMVAFDLIDRNNERPVNADKTVLGQEFFQKADFLF